MGPISYNLGYNKTTAKNGHGFPRTSRRRLCKLQLQQKRASGERRKDGIVGYSRTVEFASSRGDERNQLLFALALGLRPNLTSPTLKLPLVRIKKLNSQVFAEAAKRTKESIFKIFQQRREEWTQSQRFAYSQPSHNLDVVDLVSSDEDSDDEPVIIVEPRSNLAPSSNDSHRHSSSHHDERQLQVVSISSQSSSAVKSPTSLCSQGRQHLLKIEGNRSYHNGLSQNGKPRSITQVLKISGSIKANPSQIQTQPVQKYPATNFAKGSKSRDQSEPYAPVVITID